MTSLLLMLVQSRPFQGLVVRVTGAAVLVLLNIFLANQLGPEPYGLLAYTLSWVMLLSGMIRSGLNNMMVREVSALVERRELGLLRGLMRRGLQTVLLLSSLIIVMVTSGAIWLDPEIQSSTTQMLLLGQPIILFFGLMSYFEATTRGKGYPIRGQIAELVVRPISVLAICVLLLVLSVPLKLTAHTALLAYVVASLLAAILAYLLQVPSAFGHHSARFQDEQWRKGLFRLSAAGWLGVVNLQATPILIGVLSEKSEVASFQLASQFAFLIALMLVVMNVVQAADFSAANIRKDKQELQSLARHSCRLSAAFSLGAIIVFALFGQTFLQFALSAEFEDVFGLLILISVGVFINALSGSAGTILNSCNHERDVINVLAFAVACNVAVCLLTIPSMGALGGVIAVIVSSCVLNIGLVIRLRQRVGIWSLPF